MKKTQTLFQIVLVGVLAFGATSCSSTSFLEEFFDQFSLRGTNESMAEIAGDWTATVANFSRAAAGPVLEVDIIRDGWDRVIDDPTEWSVHVYVAASR